jgi:hypothetical protein
MPIGLIRVPADLPQPPAPGNPPMTRIDLVALQQRLAPQQQKPATPVRAEPPSWSTRPAPGSALRTAPATKACPVTASAAVPAGTLRATMPMRAALPLKATIARAERTEERARANGAAGADRELNVALAEVTGGSTS